jgi:hypothetical protein
MTMIGAAYGCGWTWNLATAVIGVRPATVFSREHSQVVMSQSQSHEWPVTSISKAIVDVVGVNCPIAAPRHW